MNAATATDKRAFTLIELLIVVSIIAILAAIAVPNFLAFQERAKVSRVKNDMRVLAVAAESYFVDHNKFMDVSDDVVNSFPTGQDHRWSRAYSNACYGLLTEPIRYVSSAPIDPFITIHSYAAESLFFMNPYAISTETGAYPGTLTKVGVTGKSSEDIARFGTNGFVFSSVGPDHVHQVSSTGYTSVFNDLTQTATSPATMDLLYDPTNGTVTGGDLIRTRRMMN